MNTEYNDIGTNAALDWKRIRKLMVIGLFAAVMGFVGDWILGCNVPDETLGGIEKKMSMYIGLSDTEIFWSSFLGFLGIPLVVLCCFSVYRLMAEKSLKYAHMYRSGILGCLIFGGCGVHVPCLALVFVYNHVRMMDAEAALEIATKFALYFLLPGTILFLVFFIVMSVAQIAAFAKGFTPYPKWCFLFSAPVGMAIALLVRSIGNSAFTNAIGCGWINVGYIWMFGGLLVIMGKAKSEK